jgi:hypothetical protein
MGGRLPYGLILTLRDCFHLGAAVETGTGLGASARWLADHFASVWTVEKDGAKFDAVSKEYGRIDNLHLRQGDSAALLPDILREVGEPALLWLDAHMPDGVGEDGSITHNCPRIEEIRAIAANPYQHYILIDDARLFTGHKPEKHSYHPELWPTLEDFEMAAGDKYRLWVHNDMALLMPEEADIVIQLWLAGLLNGRHS